MTRQTKKENKIREERGERTQNTWEIVSSHQYTRSIPFIVMFSPLFSVRVLRCYVLKQLSMLSGYPGIRIRVRVP